MTMPALDGPQRGLHRPPSKPSTAWLSMCVLLAAASLGMRLAGNPGRLAWGAGSWQHEPWSLWTASLVHLSPMHLLANLLALGAVAVLGWILRLPAAAALAWFVAWPLSTLGLLLWPGLTRYSGLSGLIHAGVAIVWVWAAMDSRTKPWSFILLAGLGLKLLTEQAWSHASAFDATWGFEVVYAAHLSGALGGIVCGSALRLAYFLHQGRG